MTADSKKTKTISCGGCDVQHISPRFSKAPPTIALTLSFEEALKLNVAVDECVRRLNNYNRSRSDGRNAGLTIRIKLDEDRIIIQEGKVGRGTVRAGSSRKIAGNAL